VPHGISGVEGPMRGHEGRRRGGQKIRLLYAVGNLDSMFDDGGCRIPHFFRFHDIFFRVYINQVRRRTLTSRHAFMPCAYISLYGSVPLLISIS